MRTTGTLIERLTLMIPHKKRGKSIPSFESRRAITQAARQSIRSLCGMKRTLWFAVVLLVVAVFAAGLSAVSGMGFWWAFVIVAATVFINEWVTTLEEDLPGSFNNPDGSHTPIYTVVTRWAIRGMGVAFVVLCLVALGLYFFNSQ